MGWLQLGMQIQDDASCWGGLFFPKADRNPNFNVKFLKDKTL
jgi:hypothetical protein